MQGRRLPAPDPGQYKTGFAVTSLEPGQRVVPALLCASWSRSRNNPGPQGLCRARDVPCPQGLCCYERWEDFFQGRGRAGCFSAFQKLQWKGSRQSLGASESITVTVNTPLLVAVTVMRRKLEYLTQPLSSRGLRPRQLRPSPGRSLWAAK